MANFTCYSYGVTTWIVWDVIHKNSKILPDNARIQENILYIENVKKINQGTYECQGETEEEYPWSQKKVQFAARCTLGVEGNNDVTCRFLPRSEVSRVM